MRRGGTRRGLVGKRDMKSARCPNGSVSQSFTMPYASLEKRRERDRKRREEVVERNRKWRKENPEKLKAQKKRYRERRKAKAEGILTIKQVHPMLRVKDRSMYLLDGALARMRKEKEKKEGVQRKEKKQRKEKQVQTNEPPPCFYCTQRKVAIPRRPVQPVQTPPTHLVVEEKKDCNNCGVCVVCGGFEALWKSVYYEWARQQNVDTMSCSSSEVDSELADRLDALLDDEFSSGEEEEVKVASAAPLRRSSRLATKPRVNYIPEWDMEEHLQRVRDLHQRRAELKVKRWREAEELESIMREMTPVDPHRHLDRFAAQLAREVNPVCSFNKEVMLEYTVDAELFDLVERQL